MLRVKSRRWLPAAAGLPLILAACTSTAGRPGAGTGTVAGSGSAAPGGLRAVRHVWVIELENQGYQQSFATPAADPYLATTLPRMGARSWAAYLQDMGNDPGRDHTVATARGPACGHPATWAADPTQKAEKGDQYAARHDGFTFFSSVTAKQAFCAAHILSFRPLPGDLARAAATPAFSFVAPDLCNDGHDAPCVTGVPGGLAQAGTFLSQWVPTITAAPAYRDGGLIVITFDEGSDAAACCGETTGISPSHPNVPLPGKTGPGGGRTGTVLLSPLIRPGTVSTAACNHYSLLRTVEDIFGLPHLGDAAIPQVRSFGPDVFG